jgi:MFS family permease
VNLGWNEGSVGIALSLMGLTALVSQTFAGDAIDKTTFDRRKILMIASLMTACSATTVMFVREGNNDHMLMYITKVIEGLASSFIGPCLAALTLACNGPDKFDSTMANNVLWGHIGSATSAVLAGGIAYLMYPNIKYCFLVIGFSALFAIVFIQFLPEGDQNLARGFEKKVDKESIDNKISQSNKSNKNQTEAASYLSVISEPKTLILCLTGFFFSFCKCKCLVGIGRIDEWGER